jgi:hypothetical protein
VTVSEKIRALVAYRLEQAAEAVHKSINLQSEIFNLQFQIYPT